MKPTKENPPAFPRDHRFDGHNGMTLRDYFAAAALQGILARMPCDEYACSVDTEDWSCAAGDAGRIADAMIAEREKRDA